MLARTIRRLRYAVTPQPPQTCKDCWRSDGIDFHVADETWVKVTAGCLWRVPGLGAVASPVLCLPCFDRRARSAGVPYTDTLVVLGVESWLCGHDEQGLGGRSG